MSEDKKFNLYLNGEDYTLLVSHYGLDKTVDILAKVSVIYEQNSFIGKNVLGEIMKLVKEK